MNWCDIFTYSPETWLLYWRIKPGVRINIGDEAGWIEDYGYRRVLYRRKKYLAHRIIWEMLHPDEPLSEDEEIDHIDHDRANNLPYNLRKVSRMINLCNKKLYHNNMSGVPGVCWRKDTAKWAVRINSGGIHMHLGMFADLFEAICMRKSAENKLSFHENHGTKL